MRCRPFSSRPRFGCTQPSVPDQRRQQHPFGSHTPRPVPPASLPSRRPDCSVGRVRGWSSVSVPIAPRSGHGTGQVSVRGTRARSTRRRRRPSGTEVGQSQACIAEPRLGESGTEVPGRGRHCAAQVRASCCACVGRASAAPQRSASMLPARSPQSSIPAKQRRPHPARCSYLFRRPVPTTGRKRWMGHVAT